MLIREVFNYASVPGDEDGLMSRFKELSNYELSKIRELLVRYEDKNYPGKDVLERGKKLFKEILQINDATAFFEKLYEVKDELLDYEEEVFDVKKFFKNQRDQFDKALKQLDIYEKNKTYVLDPETINTVSYTHLDVYKRQEYIDNWTFGMDFRLLFKTVSIAILGRGAK